MIWILIIFMTLLITIEIIGVYKILFTLKTSKLVKALMFFISLIIVHQIVIMVKIITDELIK